MEKVHEWVIKFIFRGKLLLIGVYFMKAILVLFLLSFSIDAAEITFEFIGLKSKKGSVAIAIWNNEAGFPKDRNQIIYSGRVPVDKIKTKMTFSNIFSGSYAAAFYHDKNNNNKFDKGAFGIPKVRFGFSNNVKASTSAPSFEEAKINIEEDSRITQIIKLRKAL